MATHGITLARRQRSNSTTPSTGAGSAGGARFLQPPAGVDPTKYQSALNACRSKLPDGGSFNRAGPAGPGGGSSDHVVVYKVSGGARSASVVYSDIGGANDVHVSIPYQITIRLPSGAFFSVAADGDGGTTTACEVLIDGKTVVSNTATNAAASAECHGTVP